MSIPGLFVEYLVIGTIAMLWLWPLTSILAPLVPKDEIFTLLLVPVLYVIGMIIDYVGYLLFRPVRNRIRDRIYIQYKGDLEQSGDLEARLFVHAPELAKLVTMYSSRDRVARGTTINGILAAITFVIYFWRTSQWYQIQVAIIVGVIGTVFCYLLWANCQRVSCRLEVYSLRALKEKLQFEHGNDSAAPKRQVGPDEVHHLTSGNRPRSRKRQIGRAHV